MKLSLRDFFWLMLVAAFAVGWWVQQRRAVQAERGCDYAMDEVAEIQDALEAEGLEVSYRSGKVVLVPLGTSDYTAQAEVIVVPRP